MSEWKETELTKITYKIGSGATPRGGANSYKSKGISLVRSQNVLDLQFSEDGLAFIDDEQAYALRNVAVNENDILLNITGDSVARVCKVPSKILPARVNQHVAIIRPNLQKLEANFLLYSLIFHKEELLSQSEIGATRRAITKGMIEQFKINLPPLPEQKAIAEVLSSLDDKIDLLHRQNQTLEAMAETLFRQWFVERRPEPAEGEAKEDWEEGVVGDLFTLQRGFDLPHPQRTKGSYPIYAASGYNGKHNKYKVKGPGVTTGRSGVLGNVFYIAENFWPLNTSLYIKEYKLSTPLHAYHLLKTIDLFSFNSGSAVPTLNRNHVHEYPISIPPKRIIKEFEEIVTPIFNKMTLNQSQIGTLEKLRDTLLPKLMSGEVRINQNE